MRTTYWSRTSHDFKPVFRNNCQFWSVLLIDILSEGVWLLWESKIQVYIADCSFKSTRLKTFLYQLLRMAVPSPVSNSAFITPAALKRTLQLFCIDLNGTIHVGDELLPGASEALKILKDHDVKHRFVTNTTKESKVRMLARLSAMGLEIEDSHIYTSLSVTKDYIIKKKLQPVFLIDDNAMEEFEDICVETPDSVVIGLAPQKLNYEKLNEAFRVLIRNKEGSLVAIHKGRYYQEPDGMSLGPGPFVEALEFASGKTAVTVGKPNPYFFAHVYNTAGCRPRTTIMIGDDVYGDIIGALDAGMNACLVKTGKYRKGDENVLFTPVGENSPVPVYKRAIVADSLLDAIRMLT